MTNELRTEIYSPRGVIVASLTPFRDDETLDEDRLATHLDFLIRRGVDAVMPLGGSGEYVNLSQAERRAVIEVAVAAVAGRVPVLVGALSPGTREVVELGQFARSAGADGLLVLPPYYIRPSTEGIIGHYIRVVEETGLPVIVYNNPPRAGTVIGLDVLEALADIPEIVGLKDCDRDVASIAVKIQRVGSRIAILSGDDDLEFATLLSGAAGGIWAAANLTPRLCVRLFLACQAGNLAEARELQAAMLELVNVRKLPNHPGPLKEMMAMAGRSVGRARHPLAPMAPHEREAAAAALERHRALLELEDAEPLAEPIGASSRRGAN